VEVSIERMRHGTATDTPSVEPCTTIGERLSDFSFREATEQDFRGIEMLFERRGIAPGWTVWKYLENPDGVARVFIAADPRKTIVATLVHMPRRFTTADGRSITASQVVDIYIIPELRSRGVFLGLLDFADRIIDGARFGVPYQNAAIFGLCRDWEVLGSYQRWRFPVAIGNRLAGSALAFFAPLLNGLSQIYKVAFLPLVPQNLKMKRITRFGRNFELDIKAWHGVRSMDYLNWRFIDHPMGQYRAYEFFDDGESVGYCVLTRKAAHGVLSDFVTTRHSRGCLRLLVDHCWSEGIAQLGIRATGLSLGKLGFIRRPTNHDCTAVGLPEGHWIITPCDIHRRVLWLTSLQDRGQRER